MSALGWCVSPFVRAFVVSVAAAAILLGAPPAAADDPPSPKPVRNWSIEIAPAASIGGPLDDMEDAMVAAGFGDDFELGGGWGDLEYPISGSDTTSVWGAARRRLGDSGWLVGVGAGGTRFGSVIGNRNLEGEPQFPFSIHSEVEMLTIAPMAWYQVAPAARLGAGIAVNRVDTSIGRYDENFSESSSWEPGILVEAAVTYPPASRFYFLLLVQYRWLQDGTIGPWQGTASSGEVVVFPESEIALSHGLGAVGLGIRF